MSAATAAPPVASSCPECGLLRHRLEHLTRRLGQERLGWEMCLDYAYLRIERLEAELNELRTAQRAKEEHAA